MLFVYYSQIHGWGFGQNQNNGGFQFWPFKPFQPLFGGMSDIFDDTSDSNNCEHQQIDQNNPSIGCKSGASVSFGHDNHENEKSQNSRPIECPVCPPCETCTPCAPCNPYTASGSYASVQQVSSVDQDKPHKQVAYFQQIQTPQSVEPLQQSTQQSVQYYRSQTPQQAQPIGQTVQFHQVQTSQAGPNQQSSQQVESTQPFVQFHQIQSTHEAAPFEQAQNIQQNYNILNPNERFDRFDASSQPSIQPQNPLQLQYTTQNSFDTSGRTESSEDSSDDFIIEELDGRTAKVDNRDTAGVRAKYIIRQSENGYSLIVTKLEYRNDKSYEVNKNEDGIYDLYNETAEQNYSLNLPSE